MSPISQPSSEIKQLVNHFFALVDTNAEDVGQRLADEVFTQDGTFIMANATFQGAAGKITLLNFLLNSQLFTHSKCRNITIQKGRLVHCEVSTAYNPEELCERRGWHGYLPCRRFEHGGFGWNKDDPGVCSSDENRRTRVRAQNMPIPGCQPSSTRPAADCGC